MGACCSFNDADGMQVSIKDQKKLAERQRKLNEKAVRLKQDALRDDDNVFDVAFENQGETTDTVSATDVKVSPAYLPQFQKS